MNDFITPTKKCKICKQEFPLTTEYFHKTHKGKYWNSYCIPCANEKSLAYRHANLEARREQERQSYKVNREQRIKRKRKWREDNPDKAAEAQRKWKDANREYLTEYMRGWREDNPDNIRVIQLRRKAREQGLPDTFTGEQWVSCLEYFNFCCAVCGVQLRDLFGNVEPHADHWIPLSHEDCIGTVAENMVCLCAHCNQTKHALMPEQWLKRKFSTRKANEILARIETYFEQLNTTNL